MVMRVSGLATGMDTESIISDLMKAHRIPVDRLEQKKQLMEWQRDSYREMNSLILDFRSNKLFAYRMEGTYLEKRVDLSGNTEAISVKSNSTTPYGTLTIEVLGLAKAATKQSAVDVRNEADQSFDSSKILITQNNKLGEGGNFTQSTYAFKINGAEIIVDPNKDSLDDVIKRINQDKVANVSAFYDTATGKMSFIAKEAGSVHGAGEVKDQAYIVFEDTSGDFLENVLKVRTGDSSAANASAGTHADVKINGLTTIRASNTFTVNGIEITLKSESNGIPTTINVAQDTDKMVETIKQFITDYNDMLSALQDQVNQAKYRDFPPLTNEQKKAMSEKEIEAWEDKAKSGMLKNDSFLNAAIQNLRSAISSLVDTGDAVFNSLSSIGITTGQYYENGKLYLEDETKLRAALEANPEAVKNLFTNKGTDDTSRAGIGIAERLYQELMDTADRISAKAGTSVMLKDNSLLSKSLDQLAKDIDRNNKRLIDIENRYYRQFTAMEKAIQRLNMQSAYLANAFGGGMM